MLVCHIRRELWGCQNVLTSPLNFAWLATRGTSYFRGKHNVVFTNLVKNVSAYVNHLPQIFREWKGEEEEQPLCYAPSAGTHDIPCISWENRTWTLVYKLLLHCALLGSSQRETKQMSRRNITSTHAAGKLNVPMLKCLDTILVLVHCLFCDGHTCSS